MTGRTKTYQVGLYRGVAVLLCGSILSVGCSTGNSGADGGLYGAGAGGVTYAGLKAAGVKDKTALGIAITVGAAVGVITFLSTEAKQKREAEEADQERARREAERVRERDREQNRQRNDDYYVPVGKTGDNLAVQKIDHKTNQPVGDVLIYNEKDLKDAQSTGQTVKIDGHELAGRF